MRKIKLTQGKFALVDDEDFEFLSQWKWHLASSGYALSTMAGTGKIFMHIIVNNTPRGSDTDHINRNKLDNRRKNLRTANKVINGRNRGENKNNTSGYKGISWDKKAKLWAVYIWKNYKKIHLGRYSTLQGAWLARRWGERLYWND